jgi:hypothetical protein
MPKQMLGAAHINFWAVTTKSAENVKIRQTLIPLKGLRRGTYCFMTVLATQN